MTKNVNIFVMAFLSLAVVGLITKSISNFENVISIMVIIGVVLLIAFVYRKQKEEKKKLENNKNKKNKKRRNHSFKVIQGGKK